MKRFVIVVDVQADFMNVGGALPVPGAQALIAPMNRWLGELDPADTAGVLFTFDTHLAETYPSSAEAAQFPPHCYLDTPGWESVLDTALVDPAIPCWRLRKGVFDMWAEDDVMVEPLAGGPAMARDRFFADLRAAGADEVTVIGVAADFCVRWAIEGLLARSFRVTVPTALTRGIGRDIAAVAEEMGSPGLTLT